MKKLLAISIVAILAISVLIFPAMAAVNANSVTWDAYPEWPTGLSVYGYVYISNYSGDRPTAYIVGQTNSGGDIGASISGIGSSRSATRTCNPEPPLLDYCNTGLYY